MVTVLTLCSVNYLAHARTLGDSLRKYNPDFMFVIGLVDRLPTEIEPSFWHPYELIPVSDVGIAAYADMVRKYDVVEFNTAVKPFYLEYLYRRDPAVEAVIYLDPDILVYSSLQSLVESLKANPLVLTPHSCTYNNSPVNLYYEGGMLSTGIYNLGFIGTSRSETTFYFLKWWQRRLEEFCYYRPGTGVFVDQLWVILAPLYFSGVLVEKNPGYNMCYWNHFERRLSVHHNRYFVNESHPLLFYHFSSYDPKRPDRITKRVYSQIQTFSERPDLKPIYDDYGQRLMANGYDKVCGIKYALRDQPRHPKLTVKSSIKDSVRRSLRALPRPLRMQIKKLADFASRNVQ